MDDMKALLVSICCILLTVFAAPASSAEVAVIANPGVPVTQITSAQLLDLYTGDVKEWSNGLAIVVMDLKPKSSIKDAFYKFLGLSSSRMKSIWMKNMLSGEGQPPQAQATEQDILEKVANGSNFHVIHIHQFSHMGGAPVTGTYYTHF